MIRKLTAATLLPLLLAACGGGGAVTTTNTGNVVLNDAQANYASANDNEGPIADEYADDANMPMNGADAMMMNNSMAGNGMMPE